MTASNTCDCGRPANDAYICTACTDTLRIALASIPELIRELDITITRQARMTDPAPHTQDMPLFYNYRASEAAYALANTIATWGFTIGFRTGVTDNPNIVAAWLHRKINLIRQYKEAAICVDEICAVVTNARHTIDRPPGRLYAGQCGAPLDCNDTTTCDQDLYARLGERNVHCRQCGAHWAVDDRRAMLLEEAEYVLASTTLISQAVTALGRPITPERIRTWATRGRIIAHGHDQRGRPLYRVGDVLDLLATHNT